MKEQQKAPARAYLAYRDTLVKFSVVAVAISFSLVGRNLSLAALIASEGLGA